MVNKIQYLFIVVTFCLFSTIRAEEIRWLQVGRLHNWFSAAGCEPEVGRRHLVSDQQDGFRYPADRSTQDMQSAKGLWIGARNFNDLIAGQTYSYKVVHAGPRILDLENEFMPVLMKLIRKQSASRVYVDGKNSTSLYDKADEIDASISSDEMIQNVVNTSIGITITRTIYAYGHPDHDNYFIYDFEFKNTGIYDRDGNVSTQILEDVIFFFQYRWAVSKYMGAYGLYYAPQDATWGVNTVNEVLHPEYGDAVRASYAWHGLHSDYGCDNIGGPFIGSGGTGFLGASQYPGIVTLYADNSATEKTDDFQQPKHQIPIYSDADVTQPGFNDQYNEARITKEYVQYMGAGISAQTHADMVDNGYANELPLAGGGGVSQGIGYGPYTLEPGQSIHIVMAEAAGSIDWEKRGTIGSKWYNEISPYNLPDGSTTADKNEYKNAWVFTGVDSLMQAFESAKTTWQNNFTTDPIPPAPGVFEVTSMSDRVRLQWDNQAENYPHFAGYRIYRADESPDSTFQLIYECGQGSNNPLSNQYDDLSVIQGIDYYYYVVSYDDGTVNTIDPGKSLESSRFWTLTSNSAYLREVDVILADVFVSPDGDDANDGLTTTTPFRTIGHALSRIVGSILEDRTIHLTEGIYSPSTTGDVFPLPGRNSIKIEGISSNSTIIDADSSATIFDIKDIQNFHLANLTICNGNGNRGGGIHISGNAEVKLSGVKITGNTANLGGGIYLENDAVLEMDSVNRCDIFYNSATGIGADIYSLSMVPRSICVDSFTVKNPCDYLAYPVESFQFDINAGYIPQIAGNAYVSPDGNDFNDGSSVTSPLKTFRQAIIKMDATEENSGIIHLVEGIYSPSTTGEQFPVYGRSHVKIIGSGASNCILDAEQTNRGIITSYDQNFSIENLSVQNGNSTFGGGIYISPYAKVDLKNLIIKSNKASEGGGIMITGGSSVNLSNVKIVGNQASIRGGGLYFDNYCNVQFDSLNRCDIYSNTATDYGFDIFTTGGNRVISVFLDTFTVFYPLIRYAAPLEFFQFDILHGLIHQEEADLFVSVNGDDNNSGLSSTAPKKTLTTALELIFADEERPHTIFIEPGIYSNSTNGESFPLILRHFVSLEGTSPEATIIDAEKDGPIVESIDVQDGRLSNLRLRGGRSDNGGAMVVKNSSLFLDHIIFQDDSAKYGAGIYAENYSFLDLNQVAFVENQSKYGNAIYADNSNVVLKNATIANNIGSVSLYCNNYSPLKMINSIIWDEVSYEIVCRGATGEVLIAYSDLMNGESGVRENDYILDYQESNISEDPKFVGGNPFNYMLSTESPCVDAGTPLFEIDGDTLLYIPNDQYSGTAPDIGAYQIISYSDISEIAEMPNRFRLYPNYPNPFNPSTTIAYEIPKPSQVEILIFDITGRLVRHLARSEQQPGYYHVVWNGKNDSGVEVPSGQYFLLMKTDRFRKTQKMILLK